MATERDGASAARQGVAAARQGVAAAERGVAAAHQAWHRRAWRFQILLVILVLLFAALAIYARRTPFFDVDLPVARAIQAIEVGWLVGLLEGVSWIGFPPQIVIATLLVVGGLFVAGHRRPALFLLLAGAGAGLLWFAVGNTIDRPRPDPSLVRVAVAPSDSSSFPSGHVLSTTAIFGFLFTLVYLQVRPSWWRGIALVAIGLPILTVGIARVYDGHHWPSDVLGGYLLGGLWLGIVVALYRRYGHSGQHHGHPGQHAAPGRAAPDTGAASHAAPAASTAHPDRDRAATGPAASPGA